MTGDYLKNQLASTSIIHIMHAVAPEINTSASELFFASAPHDRHTSKCKCVRRST